MRRSRRRAGSICGGRDKRQEGKARALPWTRSRRSLDNPILFGRVCFLWCEVDCLRRKSLGVVNLGLVRRKSAPLRSHTDRKGRLPLCGFGQSPTLPTLTYPTFKSANRFPASTISRSSGAGSQPSPSASCIRSTRCSTCAAPSRPPRASGRRARRDSRSRGPARRRYRGALGDAVGEDLRPLVHDGGVHAGWISSADTLRRAMPRSAEARRTSSVTTGSTSRLPSWCE